MWCVVITSSSWPRWGEAKLTGRPRVPVKVVRDAWGLSHEAGHGPH